MTEKLKQLEEEFLQYVKKMGAYNEALNLIYWDLRTGAPKKSVEQRAQVIGTLSSEIFAMTTSEEMAGFIAELSKEEAKNELSEITFKTVEHCRKEYNRLKKIPADEYREYVVLQSKAESVWEEAKEKRDFEIFRPYLEQLVEITKRFINYWGYEGNKYNTLLDMYEPGVTVETLDRVFGELREGIVPLVKQIANSKKIKTDFLYKTFPVEKQKQLSEEFLRKIGYDFEAGRLDETVHPFAIGLNPYDVRVTTKYNENDFQVALFGTIHEGGHALYEQNISKDLMGTPLCTGTSMGIHESQSLFYENIIGRSYPFWKNNYQLLQKYADGQFDHVSLDDFYRAINESKPSLIRIEADELTYPLHIIIRYEIEKGLFNDEISVDELPQVWNDKYEEYLGIRPEHDGEGVLQDVHWSGGSFGYFPSYALGFMYAAQFKQKMEKDIPDFDKFVELGELDEIRKWLTEHIHQFGAMKKPLEIIKDVTGEELNAKYLIQYLQNKFKQIYELN